MHSFCFEDLMQLTYMGLGGVHDQHYIPLPSRSSPVSLVLIDQNIILPNLIDLYMHVLSVLGSFWRIICVHIYGSGRREGKYYIPGMNTTNFSFDAIVLTSTHKYGRLCCRALSLHYQSMGRK